MSGRSTGNGQQMIRILVADDEPICLANLRFALERAAYSVQVAGAADRALAIANWFCPHILITDWMLESDCDGRELMRLLQEREPNLKTIIITGYPGCELADEFDEWGDYQVIEKPFSLIVLLESVHLLSRDVKGQSERSRTQPSGFTATSAVV